MKRMVAADVLTLKSLCIIYSIYDHKIGGIVMPVSNKLSVKWYFNNVGLQHTLNVDGGLSDFGDRHFKKVDHHLCIDKCSTSPV